MSNPLAPRFRGETDWHRTFVLFPKTSIGDRLVWGLCYTRVKYIRLRYNDPIMTHSIEDLYASKKEVFIDKLKEGAA